MKIFKKLVLFNAFFLIFFISQSNANVEKIATEIVKELPDNVILAIQPLDRKKSQYFNGFSIRYNWEIH